MFYGQNQAECCSGETAECGPLTHAIARGPQANLPEYEKLPQK
jgi:hypothetical protein